MRITPVRASHGGGLAALAWLTVSFAAAQWEPVYTLETPGGTLRTDYFGYSVAGIPDIDGDGLWDLAVGAPHGTAPESPGFTGLVHLFSGASGRHLRSLTSPHGQYQGGFGCSVAGSEDLNGDGFGDIIVGALNEDPNVYPSWSGRVHVFSGATGSLIRTIQAPYWEREGHFGSLVVSAPDFDNDDICDILVSSQRAVVGRSLHLGGCVHLFSGGTGELIAEYLSPNEKNGGRFGEAVAAVPDVNGDGQSDLLIGAPGEDSGRAYLLSGATGEVTLDLQSPEMEPRMAFGAAVSPFGDLDGDGTDEIAIGAPTDEGFHVPNSAGHVYLFSGATGDLVETLQPEHLTSHGRFGSALACVPDVNGDDVDELAVCASEANEVFLFSGARAVQMTFHRFSAVSRFVESVAGLPDLSGDGLGDLVVGAACTTVWDYEPGLAFLFHGPAFPDLYSDISIGPRVFELGDQSIENLRSASLALSNRGSADLIFSGSGFEFVGPTAEDFRFTFAPDTSPLSPGEGRTVQFALSTEHTGIEEAVIQVTTNDYDEPVIRIPISAVATHPEALYPLIPNDDLLILGDHGDATLQTHPHFGLNIGDINGDGYDDLITGYPCTGTSTADGMGSVSVVYGRPGVAGSVLDLRNEGAPASTETHFIGGEANGLLGWAVASGDIDGNSFDDIVMGAPREDAAAGPDAGKVYIIYGHDILPGDILSFPEDLDLCEETQIHGFQGGLNLGEALGSALAVGDFNADGFDDIAIGAPWSSPWNRHWAGRVYVIWGRADLPDQVLDLHEGVGLHGETRIIGEWPEDNLGEDLAAGDVDGDGLDDLIIGARMADPMGRVNAGQAYVVYGGALTPGIEIDLRSAEHSGSITRIFGDGEGTHAAESLACGDVNADGFDEIVIGSPLASPEEMREAGEVAVIWGTPDLRGATVDLRDLGSEVRALGAGAESRAGSALGVADLTGDGCLDLAIGTDYKYPHSTRMVTLLWGESLGIGERIELAVPNALALPGYSLHSPPRLGPHGGDIDRDGFGDLASARWYASNYVFTDPSASSYVLFGRGYAHSATAIEWFRAGQAPRRGIGGRLSPVLRAHVSFDGGDGPTPLTATITRSSAGIEGLDTSLLMGLADVTWELSTPRTGYLSSNVTLQYTDRELGNLIEDSMQLYQAPTASGPWTAVATQILNTHRNEVLGVVDSMGHFALMGDYPRGSTGMSSEGIVEHLLGFIPEAAGMDVNGDGVVDSADIVRNVSEISGE